MLWQIGMYKLRKELEGKKGWLAIIPLVITWHLPGISVHHKVCSPDVELVGLSPSLAAGTRGWSAVKVRNNAQYFMTVLETSLAVALCLEDETKNHATWI